MSGDYDELTRDEVKKWQKQVAKDPPQFCDGNLGPRQAHRIFARTGNAVIDDTYENKRRSETVAAWRTVIRTRGFDVLQLRCEHDHHFSVTDIEAAPGPGFLIKADRILDEVTTRVPTRATCCRAACSLAAQPVAHLSSSVINDLRCCSASTPSGCRASGLGAVPDHRPQGYPRA